jgi:eukaryotic-like serine/threonine-protein kinase
MNRDEYQKVKAVFQSALRLTPKKRRAFLDKNCRGDPNLRREVELLLNNYESGFMEGTGFPEFAEAASSEILEVGQRIGRYEILGLLGRGGMGAVYLARDDSLERSAALKVLLPEFTSDPERVNRFKREARAASALNHPNILTIYEIGEDEKSLYIAAEHIKGETLRSLLEHQSLDLASSIRIAEQAASALAAAHQAGIVHRDIKPENIMVREDGFVKILDFGLAKATEMMRQSATTDVLITRQGMIMGSVPYMSPEQARGRDTDARTDLWALGVVFYEMLTGRSPFQAETTTDTLANIIHSDPLPVAEQIDAPPELYRIVKKSLRKDVEERYQTAKDLSLDLKNLRREMELEHELELSVSPDRLQQIRSRSGDARQINEQSGADKINVAEVSSTAASTTDVSTGKSKNRYKAALLISFTVLLVGIAGYFAFSYLTSKKLITTVFKNPTIEKLPISGRISSLALSPDGKYLAYVTGDFGKNGRLFLRQMETGSEKEIFSVKDEQISLLSFSPDGNYFYLTADENYRVALLGGEKTKIPVAPHVPFSFSADGRRVVFSRATENNEVYQIVIADAGGAGESVIYSTADKYILFPKFSPDESKILLAFGDKTQRTGSDARLGWIPAAGGDIIPLADVEWDLVNTGGIPHPYYYWLKDGSGIIVANKSGADDAAQIYLVGFPNGEISRLTKDTSYYEYLSASADSQTLAVIKRTTTSGIWEYDIRTKATKQITDSSNSPNGMRGLAGTADGRIWFVKADARGNRDLWQMKADGTGEKSMISNKGRIQSPVVSADGKYVYFTTNGTFGKSSAYPANAIWRIDSDGSNLKQITNPGGGTQELIGVFSDNNALIFREYTGAFSRANVKKLDITTGQITPVLDDPNVVLYRIKLSPDGRQILYGTVETSGGPATIIYKLVDFDGTKLGGVRLPLPPGANLWRYEFAPDGKSIYYFDFGNRTDLWRFDFSSRKSTKLTDFNFDSIFSLSVTPDARKIYFARGNTTDEVMIIRNAE